MIKSGIYSIQSKVRPDRIYIGSAVNMKGRWGQHIWNLQKGIHHSARLQNHFNKYGKDDLIFSVIEPCLPGVLLEREKHYIDELNPWFNISRDPVRGTASPETKKKMSRKMMGHRGWNRGKIGMVKHTEEHKQRMSLLKKGVPRSEETKKKVSKGLKGKMIGEKNPFYGKKHSEETINKIKEANKGHIPWHAGTKGLMKHSEEWKNQHSERMKGEKNPLYGRGHTEETKEKLRAYTKTDEHRKHLSESKKGKLTGSDNPFYGKHHSIETIEKWKKIRKGRPSPSKGKKGITNHTKEWKEQHSKAMKGKSNPMYGKTHSEEAKRKIREKWIERKNKNADKK